MHDDTCLTRVFYRDASTLRERSIVPGFSEPVSPCIFPAAAYETLKEWISPNTGKNSGRLPSGNSLRDSTNISNSLFCIEAGHAMVTSLMPLRTIPGGIVMSHVSHLDDTGITHARIPFTSTLALSPLELGTRKVILRSRGTVLSPINLNLDWGQYAR